MQMKKSGVSLVVLVLTIVIMFILTGILVSTYTGGNTLDEAENAVQQLNQKRLKDLVVVTLTSKGWMKGKTIPADKFEEYLSEIKDVTVTQLDSDVWLVTKGDTSISVYNTGEIVYGNVNE